MIILESKRILFRQHEMEDLEDFCAMEMDADVRRYAGGHPRSREDAEQRFRTGALMPVSNRLSVWAAILKPDGPYIGRSGLYPHFNAAGETVTGEAALSFYIARAFWGKGLATEAALAFVEFGWEELHLARIVATVQAGNDASVRVLKKAGFAWVATEQGSRTFLKFAIGKPMAGSPE
jgi:RimJ/RimL family protein N-acetyltransferase